MSAGVASGTIAFTSAATPATCGVAELVPTNPAYAAPLSPDDVLLVGVVGPKRTVDQM
jgi:hypothetical protein